ncbi:MAG: glycoside hydrolase family 78 protein [Chloroflexi bacterium]|nr:glycoside hydrolase family 78 protein [Chloroflexota bacterium]
MTITLANLRCNYLVNPLGIDDLAPRFFWQLVSDERAVLQSAYQIQVSAPAGGILWDSGKVGSLRSVQVPYGGPPLASAVRYAWRVRVWDNHGAPTYWSDYAWFEMGLLSPDDWRARWVEPLEAEDPLAFKPCPHLRREFTVGAGLAAARLYITSRGLYEAHLNGAVIGDQLFTPGFTPYDLLLQYQTYDVTAQLTEGANALGVILGDGWYRGKTGIMDSRNVYGTRLGLLAQLALWYDDGRTELVATDEAWRSAAGPILSADPKDGEIYDARRELPGWDTAGFSDATWQPVRVLDAPLGALAASPGVPVRRKEELIPQSVLLTPDGSTVLDFGQNLAGIVHFRVEAPAGTELTLTHGEALDADGNFTLAHLAAFGRPLKQEVHYTCRGGGLEEHEARFTVHGFRYVKLQGWPAKPDPVDFRAVAVYSDMAVTGTFECSDKHINQLVRNTLWSMKSNFLDIPTDCPTRERSGWTGDAQIFARTGSFLMETAAFFTKWLRDLALEQYPSGMVPNVVPNANRPLHTKGMMAAIEGSSGWGDAAVILPWTMYQVYGDTSLLADQYSSMRAWVEYMRTSASQIPWYKWLNPTLWFSKAKRARQQLIWDTKYHWGEWLEPGSGYGLGAGWSMLKRRWFGEPTVATAYYAYSCGLLAEAARTLGYDDDARVYAGLAEDIRQAYDAEFISHDGGISPDRQASYVRALAFGLAPEVKRLDLLDHLVHKIRLAGTHLGTGFLSTPFLLPVLTDFGQADLAYELLEQTSAPSWLYAVTKGATSIWEMWDGIDAQGNPHGSLNHYSYGAVVNWLAQYAAGIEIGAPGYQQIIIQPHPGGELSWVRASYQSLYGEISSSWELTGGQMTLEVAIPPNTRATVRLPSTCDPESVLESGAALGRNPGIVGWHREDGASLIEIGSGAFSFTLPYNG